MSLFEILFLAALAIVSYKVLIKMIPGPSWSDVVDEWNALKEAKKNPSI